MDTPLVILVAEDDLGDVLMLQRAFGKAGVTAPVYFARDGSEVLDYLQGKPPFGNPVLYPLPSLLLLDLNLPGVDGFRVLEWIRAQPRLCQMVVVVLTASDRERDMNRAHALGANAYLVKPQDPNALVRVVHQLQDYWSSINAGKPAPDRILLPVT